MSKFKHFVLWSFKKHPIITNSTICGTAFMGADLYQQLLEKKLAKEKPEKIDKASLVRFAVYGAFIQGPLLTLWYRWLDATFVGTAPKTIVKKLLCEQIVCVPSVFFLFFVSLALMEGKENIFDEFKRKFVTSYASETIFWTPVQIVNFKFVPPHLRIIYMGCFSFVWTNIMCYIKKKD